MIFSGHYNDVIYDYVELSQVFGSEEVQKMQNYKVKYTRK